MVLNDDHHENPGDLSRSTGHPDSTGSTGPPARRSGSSTPEPADREASKPFVDRLTDRIDSSSGQPLTVSTDGLTVRLLGVPRVAVDEVVYAHQLDRQVDGDSRPSALFDIENTSDRLIRWNPKRTSFIGTDSYTYRGAHLSVDPARLGPGCHTRPVEIDPGCRARVMTLVERLPQSVEVARVVHSVRSRRHTDQRLTFELQ